MRTYTMQLEALKRYRTGGEQKVTVHHVSVNDGGQAIVGNVTLAGRPPATAGAATLAGPALTDARQPEMEIIGEAERTPVRSRRGKKKMTGDHPRNTGPMLASRRCGAKTRSGKPCRSPSVAGKKRCRMHGGAPGSGAPCGNTNVLKHGLYTREAIAERRQLRDPLRQSRNLIEQNK
jgi:hypothetical protein